MTLFVPRLEYTPEQIAYFYSDPQVRLVVALRTINAPSLAVYLPLHEKFVGRLPRAR